MPPGCPFRCTGRCQNIAGPPEELAVRHPTENPDALRIRDGVPAPFSSAKRRVTEEPPSGGPSKGKAAKPLSNWAYQNYLSGLAVSDRCLEPLS
jgi:hypothetical protein